MTNKITPGPWRANDRGIGYEVLARNGWPVNDGDKDTFTEADARLIAAAPDLLSIAVRAEALISGELVGAEWKQACADFVKAARAAIAKATGEGA